MILIDNEFRDLIPPLTAEEFAQLEENCVREGIREPLTVWKAPSGDKILVDGHNRFSIAAKHALPWTENVMQFDSREDVMQWIILNQFGRRNLSAYDRSLLALKLKPMIAEKAKENQKAGGNKSEMGRQNSAQPLKTRDELAKVAGVSHDTIHRVEVIEQKATPEEKEKLRKGELSINQVYVNHTVSKRKDPIKEAAKEHEAFQKAKEETVIDFREATKDKQNKKILALDLYTTCMGLGKDIFGLYDDIRHDSIDLPAILGNLSADDLSHMQGHLREIIGWVTAVSVNLVKED